MYATNGGRRGARRLIPVTVAGAVLVVAGLACSSSLALAGGASQPTPGTISTAAGGVGGPEPAGQVSISPCGTASPVAPCGVTFAGGNLYFTDFGTNAENRPQAGGLVREVSLKTGLLTTPAGAGQRGFTGDGGAATQAFLGGPQDVARDAAGNLLLADGNRIRVVAASTCTCYGQAMKAGDIYSIAGGGTNFKNGVPAITAKVNPLDLALDATGNVVFSDVALLRVIATKSGRFYGQAMKAGDIYTVAGGGSSLKNGVPAASALMDSLGLAIDAHGNLVFADIDSQRVRVVAVKAGRFYGQAMAAGHVYTVAGGATRLHDGGPATKSSLSPYGLALDRTGNIVIASFTQNRVRVVAVKTGRFYGRAMKAGDIYSVAGGGRSLQAGALATKARITDPHAVAVDSAGNLVVADDLAHRMRVVAARTGTFYGVHMTAGHLYMIAGNGVSWQSGQAGPATSAQVFPGIVADDGGSLVFADSHVNGTNPATDTSLVFQFVPAHSGTFFGRDLQAGRIYAIAGGTEGFAGDGGPAAHAEFNDPGAVAADPFGNVVIADTFNERVRVVAMRTGTFYGQAMTAGDIYSVAGDGDLGNSGDGGPATEAAIEPGGLAVDQDGNMIIGSDGLIRVIAEQTGTFYGQAMTAGDVYTIAGRGTSGTNGDGGPAIHAKFSLIAGVAMMGTNGVLVSDLNRVRMIAAITGTFYGVPMTAGDIYTVAGNGTFGITGDGGAATDAAITNDALTVDDSDNLVFFDDQARRVRVVPNTSGTFYGSSMTAGDLYTIAGGGSGGLGDGGPGNQAMIGDLVALAAGSAGVVASDFFNSRVRVIAP